MTCASSPTSSSTASQSASFSSSRSVGASPVVPGQDETVVAVVHEPARERPRARDVERAILPEGSDHRRDDAPERRGGGLADTQIEVGSAHDSSRASSPTVSPAGRSRTRRIAGSAPGTQRLARERVVPGSSSGSPAPASSVSWCATTAGRPNRVDRHPLRPSRGRSARRSRQRSRTAGRACARSGAR